MVFSPSSPRILYLDPLLPPPNLLFPPPPLRLGLNMQP